MASVSLPSVVLSLASDTAQRIVCYSDSPPKYTDALEGEVRSYGGRRRILTGDDEGVSFSQTLREVTLADVVTLRSWKGLPVLWRDKFGTKVYGVFFAVSPGAQKTRSTWDVEVGFTESTVDDVLDMLPGTTNTARLGGVVGTYDTAVYG